MVAADLIHAERDCLVFGCVFALDDKDRDAVDEKNHVLAGPVMAVMDVKLFGYFIHVTPLIGGSSEVAVVDESQVQFAIFVGAKELRLVAEIGEKVTVACDVGVQPAKLAEQCTLSLFVFWVEGEHLGVE